MHRVWVAFGSNLEDPVQQLVRARCRLASVLQESAASPLYRTPPFGVTEQPDFMNAVVRYQTELTAIEVLRVLQRIEHEHHRVRSVKNGPRTLDLDVLLYDNDVINLPDLQVPHPAMHQRDFVLQPLASIDSNIMIPNHGRVSTLLRDLVGDSDQLPIVEDALWPLR